MEEISTYVEIGISLETSKPKYFNRESLFKIFTSLIKYPITNHLNLLGIQTLIGLIV